MKSHAAHTRTVDELVQLTAQGVRPKYVFFGSPAVSVGRRKRWNGAMAGLKERREGVSRRVRDLRGISSVKRAG